ncbi:MAG: DUF2125 domain-containing protein [Pseudomonadota bacterium]
MGKFQAAAAAVVLLLAAGFAWWFVEASRLETAVAERAEALRAEGWDAGFEAASVVGAPARLDLTLRQPRLGAQGWRWDSAAILARGLIYRPDFLSLSAPGRHRFETPFGAVSLSARQAEASLVFGDVYRAEALARFSMALEGLTGTAPGGGAFEIEALSAYLRPPAQRLVGARRLYVKIDGAALPGAPPLDLEIDGRALFDRSLASDAEGAPEITGLALRPGVTLSWPGAASGGLRLAGEATRPTGAAPFAGWSGTFAFESDEAEAAIARLEAIGALRSQPAAALRARISAAGRLAGVLKIDGARAEVLDLGPEPIALWPIAPR